MSKIIAIANHKGGVGKTTTVASMGVALSLKGYNVLLIDLDPQTNLSSMFLSDEALAGLSVTMYEALTQGESLPMERVKEGVTLSPASLDLALAEIELTGKRTGGTILAQKIAPIAGNFDYILIDCPPSLGILTTNAFYCADEVYIPLTAEALPLRGVTSLEGAITEVGRANGRTKLGGILITRYNNRRLNKEVEGAIRAKYGDIVFNTRIRENITIAEAPNYGIDIFEYDSNSIGARDYTALADEIIARNK